MPRYELVIDIVGHDRATGVLTGFGSALGNIAQIAGGILSAQLFNKIASAVGDFVAKSIEATAEIQRMEVGIQALVAREIAHADATTTIGQALDTAKPKAKALMDELARVSILSPYQYEMVTTTFRQAMAFGYAADEAMMFTEATLNVAAGIGASNDMLFRMAYNLSQVRMQGKVTALDIRQLAMAGFDLRAVLQYVGQEMGVNIETHLDFNKAIEQGKITWEDFARLYEKYADENFAGASERMARTWYGLKNTFNDLFKLTMPQILGDGLQVITDFANRVLNKFLELRDSGVLEEWGTKIGEAVNKIIEPLNRLWDFVEGLEPPTIPAPQISPFKPPETGGGGAQQPDFRTLFAGLLEDTPWATYAEDIGTLAGKLFWLREVVEDDGWAAGATYLYNLLPPELQTAWDDAATTIDTLALKGQRMVDIFSKYSKDTAPAMNKAFEWVNIPQSLETIWANLIFNIKELSPAFENAGFEKAEALGGFLTELTNAVMPSVTEALKTFSNWLFTNSPLINEFFTSLAEKGTEAFTELLEIGSMYIQPVLDLLLGLLEALLQLITGVMQFATGDWLEGLKNIGLALLGFLETIATAFIQFGVNLFYAIKSTDLGGLILGWIGEMWTNFENALVGYILSSIEKWWAFKDGVIEVLNTIVADAEVWWGTFKGNVDTALQAVKGFFTTAWDDIKNFITTTLTTINDDATVWWETFKTNITTALTDIKTFFDTTWADIAGFVDDAWNAFENLLGKLGEVWTWLQNHVFNFSFGGLGDLLQLLGLTGKGEEPPEQEQTGGVVRAGASYITGERGIELFTPSQSGYIWNNQQTRDMLTQLAGGSGQQFVFNASYRYQEERSLRDDIETVLMTI